MYAKPKFLPGGDASLFIEFGNVISPEIGGKVRAISAAIERAHLPGVTEMVPTYRSVLVYLDPFKTTPQKLQSALEALDQNMQQAAIRDAIITCIPVCYGGEFGPDLDFVAGYHKITLEEVVKIHTAGLYPIYMLGFMPGFAYLGGVSEKIATPRLSTPRTRVPAGSVGIAGTQTGVYPAESPGGWQLIGRTPVKLFDPVREPPSLLKAGNYLSFHRITLDEYNKIANDVTRGTYKLDETKIDDEK